MRFHFYTDARRTSGEVAASDTIAVYTNAACTNAASLYSAISGGTLLPNPYTVPSSGFISFYVDQPVVYVIPEGDDTGRPLYGMVRHDEVVDVREYGATGDGITDDATAIQGALDIGASEVYFPVGTYVCGTMLTVSTAGQKLYGPGTIKIEDGLNNAVITLSAGCTLEGLTFDGNSANQSGGSILFLDSADVCIEGCTFTDAIGYAIHQVSGGVHDACDNLILRHCTFQKMVPGNTYNTDVILSGGGDHVLVEGNSFVDGPKLILMGATGYTFPSARVIGNRVTNAAQVGLEAWEAPGLVLAGNVVDTSADLGISVGWSPGASITGNTVNGAHDIGIEVYINGSDPDRSGSLDGATVCGNTVRDTTGNGYGIVIGPYNSDGIVVTGNTIEGGVHGIYLNDLGAGTGITISANSINGFSDTGVLEASTNGNDGMVIAGNFIYCTAWGGSGTRSGIALVDSDATDSVISGNLVYVPSSSTVDVGTGIYVAGSRHLIGNNRIVGSAKLAYGITLDTATANCLVTGNLVTGTSIGGGRDLSTTSPYNSWVGNSSLKSANSDFSLGSSDDLHNISSGTPS